jgi:hypothetical protein
LFRCVLFHRTKSFVAFLFSKNEPKKLAGMGLNKFGMKLKSFMLPRAPCTEKQKLQLDIRSSKAEARPEQTIRPSYKEGLMPA